MERDRAANQRSAFSLSFTLALYISNGFGLSGQFGMAQMSYILDGWTSKNECEIYYLGNAIILLSKMKLVWRYFGVVDD